MADITPTNILNGLPPLEWRGLTAPPYDITPINVTQTQSERLFPYIDGAGHDHTGRDPIRMTARLHFINTLALEASPRLFPDLYEQWKDACLDGSAGDLRHPLLGPIRARVIDFAVDVNARQSIAGVTMTVTWVDTLDNPAEETEFQPLENNITALATAADSALEETDIEFPTGTGDPLADALQQVEGFITSTVNTVGGVVNQVSGQIEQLVDTIDAADNALNFPARDNLVQLYGALLDASDRLGAGTSRATSETTFPFATTLSAAASELGNTTNELMTLNLALLRSPSIPPNTPIKFYTE